MPFDQHQLPGPVRAYTGNYVSFPAAMLKPPSEGNRSVPISIVWLRDGDPPGYSIEFNAASQRTVPLSQISALYIDNTVGATAVNIIFPDTGFTVIIPPNSAGYFPVVTNGLRFYAWVSLNPTPQDMTIIQVLNFLPPAVVVQSTPFATGSGTVTEVDTGPGLSGGPITQQGTISLISPVAIANGGTGATNPITALQNLNGLSIAGGTMLGTLTLASGAPQSAAAAAPKSYVDGLAQPLDQDWYSAGWVTGANPNNGVFYRAAETRNINALVGVLTVNNGATAANVTVLKYPTGATSGTPIHSGSFNLAAAAWSDQILSVTVPNLVSGDRLVLSVSGTMATAAGALFARIF